MIRSQLYLVDPQELPRYSVAEAARYLRLPASTLKTWVAGRTYPVQDGEKYWSGLIFRPDPQDPRLSFSNLIEAHVLSALRKEFKVKVLQVRRALDYARSTLGVDRVLLSPNLRVMTGNVFLRHLGKLINVGQGGQEAMPEILQAYLERIDWDQRDGPVRMWPWTRDDHHDAPKLVSIDPVIAFGRPIVKRAAVTTSAIANRFRAGESMSEIAADYDLEAIEVEEAIRYEGFARAA